MPTRTLAEIAAGESQTGFYSAFTGRAYAFDVVQPVFPGEHQEIADRGRRVLRDGETDGNLIRQTEARDRTFQAGDDRVTFTIRSLIKQRRAQLTPLERT